MFHLGISISSLFFNDMWLFAPLFFNIYPPPTAANTSIMQAILSLNMQVYSTLCSSLLSSPLLLAKGTPVEEQLLLFVL